MSVFGKMYMKCIQTKVIEHCNLLNRISNSQNGFIPGRSCAQHLIAVLETFANIRAAGKTPHCFFINFSAAFDTVNREKIYVVLEKWGVDPKLTEMLRDIYLLWTSEFRELSLRICVEWIKMGQIFWNSMEMSYSHCLLRPLGRSISTPPPLHSKMWAFVWRAVRDEICHRCVSALSPPRLSTPAQNSSTRSNVYKKTRHEGEV